jgi:hypothetical protein
MQSSLNVPDEFSFDKIRQRSLFAKLSKSGDSELAEICEALINDKDAEIKNLSNELKDVKQKLAVSASKAQLLQEAFNNNRDSGDEGRKAVFAVTEKPFYDSEIEDVILRILRKEHDAMKDDPNLSLSRKFHVLTDILEHNSLSETGERLIENVRAAAKASSCVKEGIERLRETGFTVEKEGKQPHYRCIFNDDERYVTRMSATPSDVRSSKNFAAETINLLFGC